MVIEFPFELCVYLVHSYCHIWWGFNRASFDVKQTTGSHHKNAQNQHQPDHCLMEQVLSWYLLKITNATIISNRTGCDAFHVESTLKRIFFCQIKSKITTIRWIFQEISGINLKFIKKASFFSWKITSSKKLIAKMMESLIFCLHTYLNYISLKRQLVTIRIDMFVPVRAPSLL